MKAFREFKRCIAIPNTAIVRLNCSFGKWYIGAPEVDHLPLSDRR
jgi:hypothetical protein